MPTHKWGYLVDKVGERKWRILLVRAGEIKGAVRYADVDTEEEAEEIARRYVELKELEGMRDDILKPYGYIATLTAPGEWLIDVYERGRRGDGGERGFNRHFLHEVQAETREEAEAAAERLCELKEMMNAKT